MRDNSTDEGTASISSQTGMGVDVSKSFVNRICVLNDFYAVFSLTLLTAGISGTPFAIKSALGSPDDWTSFDRRQTIQMTNHP